MVRFALSLFAVVAFLPTACQAQLFPRLFGGKQTQQVGSACPGGVCPTAAPASTYRSVGVSAAIAAPVKAIQNRAGHWSYPGSIDSHLESTHGVATGGMTRQQKLDLHDSLHEGTAAPRSNYPAVSSSVGYGSSGVRVSGYGSSGSFGVGTVLPDGAVVTSVGVTVSQVQSRVCDCCCPDCKCNQQASAVRAIEASAPQMRVGDRARLVRVMLAAAREAKAEGKSTDAIKAAMVDAGIEELANSTQAIDIDKWIEIIEKMIPLILKLIELFSQAPQAATFDAMQYVHFVAPAYEELPLTI